MGKSILLVDDQPEVREAVKLFLSFDNHLVTDAANGKEALALFDVGRYDVIITDYSMPEMRGDELARRIKALAPFQPILMISAYAASLDRSRIPVDALIGKPFTIDCLRRTIQEITQAVAA